MIGVTFEAIERAEGWLAGRIVLANPLPLCVGHFPKMPILPGFAQLLLVPELWRIAHGGSAYLSHVARARFRTAVIPGDVLRLELRGKAAALRFSLVRGRERMAEGLVALSTSTA